MSKFEILSIIVLSISAISTFLAAIVALYGEKIKNTRKLKILLKKEVRCAHCNITDVSFKSKCLCFYVCNVRQKKCVINEIGFLIGKNAQINIKPNFKLPYIIEAEAYVKIEIPMFLFQEALKNKYNNFINEKNHFKFYVIDITGKRYIYTDKMSIKSFIEDVDEEFEVLENYKTHKYQKL